MTVREKLQRLKGAGFDVVEIVGSNALRDGHWVYSARAALLFCRPEDEADARAIWPGAVVSAIENQRLTPETTH